MRMGAYWEINDIWKFIYFLILSKIVKVKHASRSKDKLPKRIGPKLG